MGRKGGLWLSRLTLYIYIFHGEILEVHIKRESW